jgi:hypothetical protein
MIAALPAPVGVAPSASSVRVVYGLAGAALGEPASIWRSTASGRAAACAPGPARDRILVCHGADIAIGGGFMARDPTYTFVDGRLAKIVFRSSIDGFSYAMASLKHRFGAPKTIVRDRIIVADGLDRAHVAVTWRNGRSTIMLSDPTVDAAHLQVNMRLDAPPRSQPSHD